MSTRVLSRFFVRCCALLIVVGLLAAALPRYPVAAQGGNLLTNPNFEQIHGNGVTLDPPPGWSIWAAESPRNEAWQNLTPVAESTTDPRFVGEGFASFHVYKQWATFNVSIYQTVSVPAGSTLRLSAIGRIWSCEENAGEEPCITGTSVRNESESGASFRVGIDPTGSNNPNAGTIVWSGAIAPYTGWGPMAVEAAASGGQVTVVLNASTQWPIEHQDVFLDQASLTVTAGSSAPPPAAPTTALAAPQPTTAAAAPPPAQPAAPTATTNPNLAAAVNPAAPDAEGNIIHTVAAGDTLAGIAVAYDVSIQQILERNGLPPDTRFIYPGQQLIIVQASAPAEAATEAATEEAAPTTPHPTVQPNVDAAEAVQVGEAEATEEAVAEAQTDDEASAEASESEATEEAADAAAVEPTVRPIEEYESAEGLVSAAAVPPLALDDSAVAEVCVTVFEETSPPNRRQEAEEGPLAGGEVVLLQGQNTLDSQTSSDDSDPLCFGDLAAGTYSVRLTAPDGYGITTPDTYLLELEAGQAVNVAFGAAEGYIPPEPPAPSGLLTSDTMGEETDTAPTNEDALSLLEAYSGLIVLGLAAVVLLGGLALAVLLR